MTGLRLKPYGLPTRVLERDRQCAPESPQQLRGTTPSHSSLDAVTPPTRPLIKHVGHTPNSFNL